jgi:hypothetical protein
MGRYLSYFAPLKTPLFLLCFTLYLLNQFIEQVGFYSVFLSSYLDDLVVMPIILSLALVGMRFATQRPDFELDPVMVIMAFVLISILFEFILPTYSNAYTKDYYDIGCYAIGTGVFWFYRR